MASSFIRAIPLTNFNVAGITPAYQAINPLGTPEPCSIIRIINASNIAVFISYDGIGDHDILLAGQTLQLDFQTNAQPPDYLALLRDGAIVYVAAPAPGVGFVFLAGYFQPNQ